MSLINFDPTAPLPNGEYEWSNPKLKYIPPEGIGTNPAIYFNNLLMLVLECNCPPSPRGLYSHVQIAPEWIPWIKGHEAFSLLAHIEDTTDMLTGERRVFLWRLQDWNECSKHRVEKEKQYAQSADEWWRLRYRAWRAVNHLYDHCSVGWKAAKEMVKNWAGQYYSISVNLPQELRAPFKMLLENVHWFDDIAPAELEDFRISWRSKSGHMYEGPYDVTQEDE